MAATDLKLNLPSSPSGYFDDTTVFQGQNVGGQTPLPVFPGGQLIYGASGGTGKIDLMSKFYEATLTGTVAFDLTSLLDPRGAALNFARVKAVVIVNFATTAGFVLKLGLGTNPFINYFDNVATAKLRVEAGFTNANGIAVPNMVVLACPESNGWAVSGTNKVIQLDSGANAVPYHFHVVGNVA